MAETALSQLPLEKSGIDPGLITEEVPFCYMQAPNGELMDLTQFCGSSNRRQQALSIPVSQPVASPPAIVVPSSPVVDGSACFGFDAQGQPCISSR